MGTSQVKDIVAVLKGHYSPAKKTCRGPSDHQGIYLQVLPFALRRWFVAVQSCRLGHPTHHFTTTTHGPFAPDYHPCDPSVSRAFKTSTLSLSSAHFTPSIPTFLAQPLINMAPPRVIVVGGGCKRLLSSGLHGHGKLTDLTHSVRSQRCSHCLPQWWQRSCAGQEQ